MRKLHMPYVTEFDPREHVHRLNGRDRQGQVLVSAVAPTIHEAERFLRVVLLERLLSAAEQGEDLSSALHVEPPPGPAVALGIRELMPLRLRLARATRGLSQSRMADQLGVSLRAYARLEAPGADPTLGQVAQLEQVLGEDLLRVIWPVYG